MKPGETGRRRATHRSDGGLTSYGGRANGPTPHTGAGRAPPHTRLHAPRRAGQPQLTGRKILISRAQSVDRGSRRRGIGDRGVGCVV
eukprot:138272-Prymnesium_polylepis.1